MSAEGRGLEGGGVCSVQTRTLSCAHIYFLEVKQYSLGLSSRPMLTRKESNTITTHCPHFLRVIALFLQ